jgi:type VI secretion system Hcp family effector
MRKSAFPVIGFALAAVLAGPALGAPIYMQYEGVPGEASAAGHDKWIEIQSCQFAPPPPAVPRAPAPAGVASGGPGRLSLTKRADKASPLLSKAAVTGKLVPAVQIDVSKPTSQNPNAYLRYELKNVMVRRSAAAEHRRNRCRSTSPRSSSSTTSRRSHRKSRPLTRLPP